MKRKLTITSVILGLSVVAGSAYAASNTNSEEAGKTILASSIETISKEEAAKLGIDITDYEQMAKEKGITVEKLFEQLEKEGKMTKAVQTTEAVNGENTKESMEFTDSSEPVNLEEMAKEKGITVEKLIAQLEKEGKLTKAAKTTEAVKSDNTVNLDEMAKEKGITVEKLIAQLEKEGKLTKAADLTEATEAVPAKTSDK
ncbi:hypothetical protein [Solibacillus cecembensis]|uniref:hypothetical protein n=1 Tax=Solibacillus cecembensis TaxID=459347 RepID=UPI003D05BF86